MVNVPVDDRDPLEPELGLRVARRDRHVVEQAEAHRSARQRVVAGRADEREPAALRRVDRAARCEQRRFPARLRRDGIRVEQRPDLDRLEPVEVRRLVAAFDLLARRRPALDVLECVEQHRQPLPRLDVRLGRMELRERRVAYELDLTASASVSRSVPPCARPTR